MATQSFTGNGRSKKFYLPIGKTDFAVVTGVTVGGSAVKFTAQNYEVRLEDVPADGAAIVVTYTIPVEPAPAILVGTAAPDNNDGMPNGTIYIQLS